MLVFTEPKIHLGLFIEVFLAGIVALSIPHALIGGCGMMTMACRKVAFPALTVESVVLLLFSTAMVVISGMKKTVLMDCQ